MLARNNRVSRPTDFRFAVRSGRRFTAAHVVVHIAAREGTTAPRFGFIVPKAVGTAVVRNRVRRRLRALCRDILPTVEGNLDVVVRALPGSDSATWDTLQREVSGAMRKAGR